MDAGRQIDTNGELTMVGKKIKNIFGKVGTVYQIYDDMICVLWASGRYGWIAANAVEIVG